ncbi:MAG: hypothetical protein HKN44_16215 [Ilumatobacter sp.]|nr:hypothetical protein [Ilumatobacter sp.]
MIGVLPWADAALDADAASVPLLDHAEHSPLIAAIRDVVDVLVGPTVGGRVGA